MNKPQTVLILGAGASIPYGFPSGGQLIEKLADLFSNDEYQRELGNDLFDEDQINYAKQLRECVKDPIGYYSIDALIACRPNLSNIARKVVVDVILKAENFNINNPVIDKDDDWYKEMFSQLLIEPNPESILHNNISILTFNYDRSLEYYIIRSLMRRFEELSWEKAFEIVSKLDIIHINGSLGELSKNNIYGLIASNHDILFISENKRLLETKLNKIHNLINKANRIIFLGVGYHNDNMKLLKSDGPFKKGLASGTGVNLGEKEKSQLCLKWGVEIAHPTLKSLTFLKNNIGDLKE